jgi:ABC-type Mn2+/Zn2+ transport system ATPase subunit
MSAMPALSARGLAVGYEGRAVVSGIDLELPRGATIALVGTNGSGKSTLLKTAVGILPPCAGEIEVLGRPAGSGPTRIGYLGQFHGGDILLPLRAADIVMMGRYPGKGLLGQLTAADRASVAGAMERLEIAHLAGEPLRELSGGQQQRVYIAQVLAQSADLIVLDEAGAGLDAAGAQLLLDVLDEERARGAAVVMATHDIGDAMRADLVLLLAGRVVGLGKPEEVLSPEALLETFGLAIRLVGGVLTMDPGHRHGPHDPARPGHG